MATPARDPACYSAVEGAQAGSPALVQLHHSKGHNPLHVWDQVPNLGTVKGIAEHVRAALRGVELQPEGYRLLDLSWSGARYLRDPSGKAHAVVTLEALLEEPRP